MTISTEATLTIQAPVFGKVETTPVEVSLAECLAFWTYHHIDGDGIGGIIGSGDIDEMNRASRMITAAEDYAEKNGLSERDMEKLCKETNLRAELAEQEEAEASCYVTFPIKAKISDLLRPTVEVEKFYGEWSESRIEPDDLAVGDLMASHGYICKIESVNVWPTDGELPVYVFKCSYVAGSLSDFKWMIGSINNGCDRGHLSHEQGNRLAKWNKVTHNDISTMFKVLVTLNGDVDYTNYAKTEDGAKEMYQIALGINHERRVQVFVPSGVQVADSSSRLMRY